MVCAMSALKRYEINEFVSLDGGWGEVGCCGVTNNYWGFSIEEILDICIGGAIHVHTII